MPAVPNWKTAVNGSSRNLEATNHSGQINQLLGSHAITPVYRGNQALAPNGGTQFNWDFSLLNDVDVAQPFTLSGGFTSIGRITVPLACITNTQFPPGVYSPSNAVNILVSLCPDNGSGAPNTSAPIVSTLFPGPWVRHLGDFHDFTLGNVVQPPATTPDHPVANQYWNTRYASGGISATPWLGPSADSTGSISQNPSITVSGNFLVLAGGNSAGGSTPVTGVNVIPYLGGSVMGSALSQPPLPQATKFGGLTATGNALVFAGGLVSNAVSTVWVAGWNSNTGVVGTWSSQTSLPTPIYSCGAASFGNTVYMVGGATTGGTVVSNVYYSTVNNGQINSWSSATPLPQPTAQPVVGVIGNWLIVAGGTSVFGGSTPAYSNVWYAKINADGSLGHWRTGPNLPAGISSYAPGWDSAITDYTFSTVGGFTSETPTATNLIQTLSVSPTDGPADVWTTSQWRESGVEMTAAFSVGDGTYTLVNTNIPVSQYFTTRLLSNPVASIPLPATGLTPGTPYYVVFQNHNQNGDSLARFEIGTADDTPLPSGFLVSNRHSGVWSLNPSGASTSLLLSVYDQSFNSQILHTWEDPSSTGSAVTSNQAGRITALVYNQYKLPYVLADSLPMPNDPMNINPTFTTGVTNWTPHNGTFVQSNAQTQGGFPFSGLLTPNGTSATVNVTSEFIPVVARTPLFDNGQWFMVNGWLYSPTGWPAVSINVDWFDSSSSYISSSTNSKSISSATWTNVVNYYRAPVNASFASISVIEFSTPAVTNTLYLSNITFSLSPEAVPAFSPVSQITYGTTVFPSTGIVQLN